MKHTIKIAAICLLAFFIAACSQTPVTQQNSGNGPSWSSTLSPLPQETIVKVGMKQVISDAGILIGMAKNYYHDVGIRVEPVQFNNGQEMINQLAAGQLDVGATVTSSGLFNAMSRDIPVKIVADKGINIPGQGYYRLVVRKDLEDIIKDYQDLRNKRIAIVGTASLDEIALSRVLQKGSLTTKDVDVQVIRSFPDMLVSLGNKSIDAAMIIEPFVTLSIEKNLAVPWKDPADYDPDAQTALLVYGTSMTKHPDIANRFMAAYVQSLRDYNDGFVKNKNRAEIIDILCNYSAIKDPALYEKMYPTGLNPNGYIRKKGIAMDLEWYKENNLLKSSMTLEDVVDDQYVDFAIKTLGTYQ